MMRANVHDMHAGLQAICALAAVATPEPVVHRGHMRKPKKPEWTPTYLRPWRERADKSLDEVARKIGIKYSQLSRIERGLQPYNQRVLEVCAAEYGCTIADLLTRPPGEAEDLYSFWGRFDARQKRNAARHLRAIAEDTDESHRR